MAAMLQMMQAQQEQQQRWLRAQQEGQAEQREMMQLQMEALRGVDTANGVPPLRDRAEVADIKLARMTEADNVEAYLTTFERVMQLGRISEELWTLKLAPQLIGKAQQAYAAMSNSEATDYKKVKEAPLML